MRGDDITARRRLVEAAFPLASFSRRGLRWRAASEDVDDDCTALPATTSSNESRFLPVMPRRASLCQATMATSSRAFLDRFLSIDHGVKIAAAAHAPPSERSSMMPARQCVAAEFEVANITIYGCGKRGL